MQYLERINVQVVVVCSGCGASGPWVVVAAVVVIKSMNRGIDLK